MPPRLEDYARKPALARTFENQVLYGMCLQSPLHDDASINAGKIILIGRTYAASPQRGAGAARDKTVDFFDAIGGALAVSCIDDSLAEVGPLERFAEGETMKKVVSTHELLVNTLVAATKSWAKLGTQPRLQASFASKYLHFHRPNAFPLMDGRAKIGLRQNGCGGTLATYQQFCIAFLRFAKCQKDDGWTPRSLDALLLGAPR